MSNLSPEWQAMAKLVSQFYAKADAGESLQDLGVGVCDRLLAFWISSVCLYLCVEFAAIRDSMYGIIGEYISLYFYGWFYNNNCCGPRGFIIVYVRQHLNLHPLSFFLQYHNPNNNHTTTHRTIPRTSRLGKSRFIRLSPGN